jgi:hypothetical protein
MKEAVARAVEEIKEAFPNNDAFPKDRVVVQEDDQGGAWVIVEGADAGDLYETPKSGVGSIVAEYLARLGVGTLVLVDPDRLEPSNLPRVVGSTRRDAMLPLTGPGAPAGVCKRAARVARLKVDIANREARRGRCDIEVIRHPSSVTADDVARDLAACDYLFLAADSMQARLVFNALVHQYLIPGTQLGAKVPVDEKSGEVGRVFSVARPIMPGQTCLVCNGLISASKLQEEALTPEERRAQRYVDEPDIPAPSVITLNAVVAAHGVNDYLFRLTALRDPRLPEEFVYYEPRTGSSRIEEPRRDHDCVECGEITLSRFARGDAASLPTEEPRKKRTRRTPSMKVRLAQSSLTHLRMHRR